MTSAEPKQGMDTSGDEHALRTTPEAMQVQRLQEKLWGGFAELAAADLEKIRTNSRSTPAHATAAAHALARYYAACNQFEKALDRLGFARATNPEYKRHARILEIHCLLQLDRIEHARRLINKTLQDGIPHDGCMNAAMASAFLLEARRNVISPREAAEHYLESMSRPLRAAGHVGIKLRNPERPLALDNLAAETEPLAPETMPVKVSVLMAVYNGAANVDLAIRSILEQSWRNLELVVVDDASTDDSWSIIKKLAGEDSRIVPLRLSRNSGAYVARNTALAKATGDYVVVNDADDWAHPQKIEAQVSHLLRYRNVISNMTFRVRVTSDMDVLPRLDSPHVPIIHNDYSALMLSRKRALALGGWDPVRFSADAEFVERLIAIEGPQAVQRIRGGMPLSFSLWDAGNLTTSGATSIWTNRFGSRHEYVRQFREWHQSGESLKVSRTSQQHPFPVPGISYFPRDTRQKLDVVLITSTGLIDNADLAYCLDELRQRRLNVGIMTWPQLDAMDDPDASDRLSRLSRKLGAVPVVHGERVRCRLLLVHPPESVHNVPDSLPELTPRRIVVLAGKGRPDDVHKAGEVISTLFGRSPACAGLNGLGNLLNRTFIRKRIGRIARWFLRRIKTRM